MATYEYWETNVGDIKGKMERGELIPDPEWQRGYVWTDKDDKKLIDSILQGIPIPKFFLTQIFDTKKSAHIHYAVDGQQRLKAIQRFMTNLYPITIGDKELFFKDLDTSTQGKITGYKLNGHYLKDYNQSDITLLFERLNSTGIKLTNVELWNNSYFNTYILNLVKEIYEDVCKFPPKRDYRDYDDNDRQKLKSCYIATIYTDENIKRMLPLDDIIDLLNCINKSKVEGGGKRDLETFLKSNKDISKQESQLLKNKFRKTLSTLHVIFTLQELENTEYRKRTHFISLFLAINDLIKDYYILEQPVELKQKLIEFINNQPDDYKESVLGAIRQKAAREKRVKHFKDVILPFAKPLDSKRLFDEKVKLKMWQSSDKKCKLCNNETKLLQTVNDCVIDHIIPWAKGGKTIEKNGQIAHKLCNQKKRDSVEEFIIF